MGFKFRYEVILHHYSDKKSILSQELALLQRDLLSELARLDQCEADLQESLRSLQSSCNGGTRCNVAELQHMAGYIHMLHQQREYVTEAVAKLNGLINDKREELVGANKQCKIMERLKEREFTEFRGLLEKIDQKAIDEQAVRRYAAAHT